MKSQFLFPHKESTGTAEAIAKRATVQVYLAELFVTDCC